MDYKCVFFEGKVGVRRAVFCINMQKRRFCLLHQTGAFLFRFCVRHVTKVTKCHLARYL